MEVLLINGSPRKSGNTNTALLEIARELRVYGIESKTVWIGTRRIRGCIACGRCVETEKCVFNDVVNELAPKFEEADGLVVASPVYYASANATLIAVLDRLFYSSHFDKTMKPSTCHNFSHNNQAFYHIQPIASTSFVIP